MTKTVLLTSFQTWLPHQVSNSSDDLLAEIENIALPARLSFFRNLPVDILQASSLVIDRIKELSPEVIVCCGMAERSLKLKLELNATSGIHLLQTSVDLEKLVANLSFTEISHDAGKFVCEGLYYQVLEFIQSSHSSSQCVFVHVPILTSENLSLVVNDFTAILEKLTHA